MDGDSQKIIEKYAGVQRNPVKASSLNKKK
jgi:hypothetical protein